MIQGKKKYLTFSYDDGVTQDKRLIKIFDRYGLKATFNINSELLGRPGYLRRENMWIGHNKIEPDEAAVLYQRHEVAAHTLTHPHLVELKDEEVVRQVEMDRQKLEELTGRRVTGLAYPGGAANGVNFDDRIVGLIRDRTKIAYARTTECSLSFDLQTDLLRFKPTVYHMDFDRMMELGEAFIKLDPKEPKLFFIWGHSYEFDYHDTWGQFEAFCRMMGGRDDIYYGTNRETLLM